MPALYIVLEQENPSFNPDVDGRALSRHEEELDQIASSLSVTPRMEFFSMAPEEAAGVVEGSGGAPSSMTFEAGRATVRALREYAAEHPEAVPGVEAVRADLGGFERVLQSAQAHGLRWHLAVDY